jgi:hypothetical protein
MLENPGPVKFLAGLGLFQPSFHHAIEQIDLLMCQFVEGPYYPILLHFGIYILFAKILWL